MLASMAALNTIFDIAEGGYFFGPPCVIRNYKKISKIDTGR